MERVSAGITVPSYNAEPPFDPGDAFPETPFRGRASAPNRPYRLLRRLFLDLALDAAAAGTREWNPLKAVISPGQTVVLKPNFVLSFNASGGDLFAVVTHPSIIRALVDFAYLALRGEGRIIIADAPQMDCDWGELMAAQRLDAIQDLYRSRLKFDVEVCDLRTFAVVDRSRPPYSANRRSLPGDPAGSVTVDLGRASAFHGLPSENYYGADYDRAETIRHHQGERHEYQVSKTVLAADAIISVPKMKVHKKVGVTLNLKGLVGINTNKNCLVHYRLGTPSRGGDQLPDGQAGADMAVVRAQRWLYDHALARRTGLGDAAYRSAAWAYRSFIKPFRPLSRSTAVQDAGNWHGNDSAWRMTADLLKIVTFCSPDGTLKDSPQRKTFCVVDGIVGGEKNGPLEPDAKRCGCLVAGSNPPAVDMVAARLMGFDVRRLKQFEVISDPRWDFGLRSPSEIEVVVDGETVAGDRFFDAQRTDPIFGFRPHPGWTGHVEVDAAGRPAKGGD